MSVPGPLPARSTTIVHIGPAVDEVPANLLRFSVAFSAPMREGSAEGHIRLRDAGGTDVAGALLPMPPELWDHDRRHLTVLLEPGRIKRGLQPNLLAGAPLSEGSTVTLVVEEHVRDSSGAELVAGGERRWVVGPAVRSRVDPARWRVRWPEAAGDPLEVRFDRSLDRLLAQRCLRVRDGSGHPVPGRSTLDATAMTWVFTPEAGASPDLTIEIDTRLEDLAGNSVRRIFDRDLARREDDGIDATYVYLTRDGT